MPTSLRKRQKSAREETSHPLPFLKEPSPSFFPSGKELVRLFAVVVIASSVAMACNYVAVILNRPPKPYCDSGDTLDNLYSSNCEPCPEHGECSGGKLECLSGYKKQGKSCVDDNEVHQMAKEISEWMERHLCEAYAGNMCGGTGVIWFPTRELLGDLDQNKLIQRFSFDNETFRYAKEKAVESVAKSSEKRRSFDGVIEFKCPELLAEKYKPLFCVVRQWIHEHALLILPTSAMLLGLLRLTWRIRRKWSRAKRAEKLYEQVCEILEESAQALVGGSGPDQAEPWMVASRLRDHLLLPKERKDALLWREVEELVREDSRIDQYPKLVKGEQRIVWEWQVKGTLSSRRRSLKPVSRTKVGKDADGGTCPPEKLQPTKLFYS